MDKSVKSPARPGTAQGVRLGAAPAQVESGVTAAAQWHASNQVVGRLARQNTLDRTLRSSGLRGRGNQAIQRLATAERQRQTASNIPIQRVKEVGAAGKFIHIEFGPLLMSEPQPKAYEDAIPLVIEVMEGSVESAHKKLRDLAATKLLDSLPIAVIICLNSRLDAKFNTTEENFAKDKRAYVPNVTRGLKELMADCDQLAQAMEELGFHGGVFPLVWLPTSIGGGYTFPFLEIRSLLTLHPGSRLVHEQLQALSGRPPIVRGMDADVSDDFLLQGKSQDRLSKVLAALEATTYDVVSGGYEWNVSQIDERKLVDLELFDVHTVKEAQPVIEFLRSAITIVNQAEHRVRFKLLNEHAKAIYWPEPNIYMRLATRLGGAEQSHQDVLTGPQEVQQEESTRYVRQQGVKTGAYTNTLTTLKPLKTYFDDLIRTLVALRGKGDPNPALLEGLIRGIRQTHLDIDKVDKNLKWHGVADKKRSDLEGIVQAELSRCASEILADGKAKHYWT